MTVVGDSHTIRLEILATGLTAGDWMFGLDDFAVVPTVPYVPIDGVC